MTEQPVSFDTAELAMQKRFDGKCNKIYNHIKEIWKSHYNDTSNSTLDPGAYCTAPTQNVLQKWLREYHKLHITITSISQESWQYHVTRVGQTLGNLYDQDFNSYDQDFNSYEEALESGLQEALKLIK